MYKGGFPGLFAELLSNPSKVAGCQSQFNAPSDTGPAKRTFNTRPMIRACDVDDYVNLLHFFDDQVSVLESAFDYR